MSIQIDGLRAWRSALLAGVIPLLILGFLTSALANRLVFLAWGLVAALAFSGALRRGFEGALGDQGDSGATATLIVARIASRAGLALGFALVAFGGLVANFGEELDSAFHAFLPALYHPLWARPATSVAVGAALLILSTAAHLFLRQSSKEEGATSRRTS